jgi:hypothetical protein
LRSRTFFPLTQACKQIRLEYRPLWLRRSLILVDFSDLEGFLTTFYCVPGRNETSYRDAPQELTISWDHDKEEYADDETLIDIGPLLKLRAYSPTSSIKFECRRILEHDFPCTECHECGGCIHTDNSYGYGTYAEASRYNCWHEDTMSDVMEELHAEYSYLFGFNDFLSNVNAKWLNAIQDMPLDFVELSCTMGAVCEDVTIYIRFRKPSVPEHLRTRDTRRGATAYLTEMGMADLDCYEDIDFIVGIHTDKWVRSADDGYLYPVHEQALIHGTELKTPSTSTGPGTQILNPVAQG